MKRVDDKLAFAATDLSNGLGCGHLSELDHQVTLGSLARPFFRDDPVLQALMEQGRAHEQAYLEYLRVQGTEVAVVDAALEGASAVEQTHRLMGEGAPVIYQAYLVDPNAHWEGRADFLVRVAAPSRLGSYSYEVVDTKLAAETRAGTLLQLCLYSDLVQQVQGRLPETMAVVTPTDGFTLLRYRVAEYQAYYRLARGNLIARLQPTVASYPEPVEQCDICRWWSTCNKRRRDDDHLSFVAGVSRSQRTELNEHGIASLRALAEAPDPLAFKPKRGSRESLARVQHQAQLQLRGRVAKKICHELIQPVQAAHGLNLLPEPSPGDLFLDLEGDQFVGTGGLEYLFGWGSQENGKWRYEHQWAYGAADEKRSFERFMQVVAERLTLHSSMHIYHYAPYEPSALKRLSSRYGVYVEALDELLRGQRFVDLYRVVRQGMVASVERYSIKDMEPLFGFARQVELSDVRKHKRAVEGLLQLGRGDLPADSSEVVRQYNEDDCRATLALRDWLEAERAQLAAVGELMGRPAVQSGDASEDLSQWLARIQGLEQALLRELPEAERTPDEQARWLLAHLLRWHHRENKCMWWERFRLCELEREDLADEPKGLAGLTFDCELDKAQYNPKWRSLVLRYRFEPQELDIRAGDDLLQPRDRFPAFGEVVDINNAEGWVIVKTSKAFDPRSVEAFAGVIKDESVPRGKMPTRLEDVAQQAIVDDLDIAASNPLAAKLLRRTPMDNLPLTLERPWDIVRHLNGDVLPVQGPPGSGKSYAGARMIVRLHQAGKKVGVTANSHAVIENLLRAVPNAAAELGVPVPRMMRAQRSAADRSDDVIVVKDTDKALAAFADGEVDVLGGTVWLWSSDEAAGLVDTLFIDEAGQLSLANAVACTQATTNLVLLGDPQQLAQPTQATHPEGTDVSALQHLIGDAKTLSPKQGLFLESTFRLHPAICTFVSEMYYDDRLHSAAGREKQAIGGATGLEGSGLRLELAEHAGNSSRSLKEVACIKALADRLLAGGTFTDHDGKSRQLVPNDILIVAPFNAQVNALRDAMPGLRVGTVDKFQGQEAPVVIYGMTSSSPEEAPRGMEFLYDPHRLNVAVSRARALTILVATPALLNPAVKSPRQMQLANALARYAELASEQTPPPVLSEAQ